jgi:hypothetical protein
VSTNLTKLGAENDAARDELRKYLARLGNEFRAIEEALDDKRIERLDAMVAASETGLLTNEEIWQVARAARTTFYNELERIKKEAS